MKWRGAAIGGGATSGKLGPAVASRNKGGQYLRSRVVPSGATPTPLQEVIRNAVRNTAPAWSRLTQSQRDAWNTYAVNVPVVDVLGDTIQLSGQNWYTGANVLQAQINPGNSIADGPTVFNRGGVDLSAATWAAGGSTGTLTLADTPTSILGGDADSGFAVYQGRDYSPGRSKYFGSFQLVAVIPGNATGTSFTLATAFAHNVSNAQSIQIVTFRSDGRYSTPSRVTVTP